MIDTIIHDIENLHHPKTGDLRKLAKSYKNQMRIWPIQSILDVCEQLLEKRTWGTTIVAYQIAYDHRSKYTPDVYETFEQWTYRYIRDWWDCDDFMTHAFSYLLTQYPQLIENIFSWLTHAEFAIRRSAPVILIPLARKGLIDFHTIKSICDTLLEDEHYLVQKGLGWLLKESAKEYHDHVYLYVKEHVTKMTRTAFRYALEKLPIEERNYLMSL